MNATKSFFNAIKLASKPAAIGFAIIAELALATTFLAAVSTLLSIIIPVLLIATKAAILGYPLFLLGLIIASTKQQNPAKEANTIAILPPKKHVKLTEIIENEVLITPPADEDLLYYDFFQAPEILQESRNIKPLNNQLALSMICWEALAEVTKLLDKMKASELKSIASELKINKYRSMNKSQLLIEIIRAQEEAPEFSQ